MDDERKRREKLPEHETRPEQTVGGSTAGTNDTAEGIDHPDPERLRALPEHELDPRGRTATGEYADLSSAEAAEIDQAAVNPDDIEIDFDDRDGDNETPPITRSG